MAYFKQKCHGPSCSTSLQCRAVGTGLGLRSGKGNAVCAKSTRSHPEVWQRVTWSRKSRWGASSPCAATRKGPATTLPARKPPPTPPPLSRSLPLSSRAHRPPPRPATGVARATPSASGAKGSFQKYLQISTSGCHSHAKSRDIYRGMRTKAGVLSPSRTTFHCPPRARSLGA